MEIDLFGLKLGRKEGIKKTVIKTLKSYEIDTETFKKALQLKGTVKYINYKDQSNTIIIQTEVTEQ